MCHVLIIEDEPLVAMHIEALLQDVGATSFAFAATEADAVVAARTTPPTLITSDVKLLAGAGPVAVQQIVTELGPIPVIFITATPTECSPRDPAAIVLTKPLSRVSLVQAFHTLVGDHHHGPQA